MAFIPPELIAYCLLAGGLYLALIDLLQIWMERVFSKMGLWENYPKSLIKPTHTGGRIWNFVTQLFLFVAIPTLTYGWFQYILPVEGVRAGVAIALWAIAVGAVPVMIQLSTRMSLPGSALVFFLIAQLIKLSGSLAIIGILFSL